jgi:ring-1,2-phenylacetyl-CoA epoxidase subunit PaaD
MNTLNLTEQDIWAALAEVPDPEMPFVNLVELGIVRLVDLDSGAVRITITPTFAGCPAYEVMGEQIKTAVRALGVEGVSVEVTHNPPWTSEWITEGARAKLKAAGLAPPPRHAGDFANALLLPVSCPRCGSMDTKLQNSFGSTPCRMIFTCKECLEPFEQFKPL